MVLGQGRQHYDGAEVRALSSGRRAGSWSCTQRCAPHQGSNRETAPAAAGDRRPPGADFAAQGGGACVEDQVSRTRSLMCWLGRPESELPSLQAPMLCCEISALASSMPHAPSPAAPLQSCDPATSALLVQGRGRRVQALNMRTFQRSPVAPSRAACSTCRPRTAAVAARAAAGGHGAEAAPGAAAQQEAHSRRQLLAALPCLAALQLAAPNSSLAAEQVGPCSRRAEGCREGCDGGVGGCELRGRVGLALASPLTSHGQLTAHLLCVHDPLPAGAVCGGQG